MAERDSKSKKRSAASSRSKPLEAFVFFIDRNLGRKKVAQALRQAGLIVEVHDDHFPPNARDVEWLHVVGAKGWVVLTRDKRIRHRMTERSALLQAGVRAFVLASGNMDGPRMAQTLVDAIPEMHRLLANHSAPFIATVTKNAKVAVLPHER